MPEHRFGLRRYRSQDLRQSVEQGSGGRRAAQHPNADARGTARLNVPSSLKKQIVAAWLVDEGTEALDSGECFTRPCQERGKLALPFRISAHLSSRSDRGSRPSMSADRD